MQKPLRNCCYISICIFDNFYFWNFELLIPLKIIEEVTQSNPKFLLFLNPLILFDVSLRKNIFTD